MTLQFHHHQLDNGLTIIAEHAPDAHTAAIGFFVKTGARDETSELMGVSHFLEHMMFKGTDRRTAADVDRDFDDLGANHNAFTTHEMTAFYAHCLPEHLPAAEEVLSDIMRPAIRPEDFNDEKSVILEEIAMYDDQPFWTLYEKAMEHYYGSHPMSHRVLGTNETIENLQQPQLQDYFTQRYSADNTVVALAGRVDFDDMVKRIEDHCGGWNRTDAKREHRPVAVERSEFVETAANINQHYMLMMSPAPALQDELRYPAAALAQVLGDTDGSRLYWALIETGLAEEAQAYYDGRDGVGDYMVYASCSVENAEKVEAVIRTEIDALINSVDDDDLTRIKSRIATAATFSGELPAGRMRRLGQQWTYYGAYRSLEDELERINAVTLDDLRAAHEAYPIAPTVIGRLSPE